MRHVKPANAASIKQLQRSIDELGKGDSKLLWPTEKPHRLPCVFNIAFGEQLERSFEYSSPGYYFSIHANNITHFFAHLMNDARWEI